MKKNKILVLWIVLWVLSSCESHWLDIKRDQKLVVPQTLEDLQALLNNSSVFNVGQTPSIGEISTDDYYVSDKEWTSTSSLWQKNAYIWEEDVFKGVPSSANGWDLPYRQVFYTNVVLETLGKIERTGKNAMQWDYTMGTALFWRSWAFYHLTQLFCRPFDKQAHENPGIPLPMESDVNVKHGRATLQQSYERVLTDLTTAVSLLPVQPLSPVQASKAAGYGLLARTYLQMGNYQKAYENADMVISAGKSLVDYNTKNASPDYPFTQFNPEVILEASLEYYRSGLLIDAKLLVDTTLLNMYPDGDLRRALFYKTKSTGITFKGSYSGSIYFFSGIGVDEVYLIKTECAVRLGKTVEALDLLNHFLKMRMSKEKFIPLPLVNPEDLLDFILLQRRLQLPFRGLRWGDIRRLNVDGYEIVMRRTLNNLDYRLEPNSNKYALPIPPEVIEANPKIIQNSRK